MFRPTGAARQRGAIAIMSALVLLMLLGFFALAIDLARVQNRRAELHTLADAVALAAAAPLDGTRAGVRAAVAAARAVVEDQEDGPRYQYASQAAWSDAAIAFGATRDGSSGWKNDAEAGSAPGGLRFVKIDTGALAPAHGRVAMVFAPVLSASFTSVDVRHVAVAGKTRLDVAPLAVCAMSPETHARRANPNGAQYDELVEYGFRRGVGYDLMRLNPNGGTPLSFQVDPVSPGNSGTTANNFANWIYNPYLCSGTMALPALGGSPVRVRSPFPASTHYSLLNSRFDNYSGACDVHNSPADSNVKPYPFAGATWMAPKPTVQSARIDSSNPNRLQTVAELGPPNHPVAADYGVLWSFARPVPWSAYAAQGATEPPAGYPVFDATPAVWKALYGTASSPGVYPAATPYLDTGNPAHFQAPTMPGRASGRPWRRVLNVPLLQCPVAGSSATVLGIGRFFLTVPATPSAIHAEFGGLVSEQRLRAKVEIYQ